MYDRILISTDGSDTASRASDVAVALARQFDADLHAVYVHDLESLPFEFDEVPEELTSRSHDAVNEIERRGRDAGLDVTTAVLEGEDAIHETIIDYAIDHDIECIVMGTHGRSGIGRFVLGSVTEWTVRASPIPVLSVHEETDFDPPFDAILAPTDGSEGAKAAVDHAIELALAEESSLHIVHVVDIGVVGPDASGGVVLDALEEAGQKAIDDAIARAQDAGVSSVQATLLSGSPHRAICDYADKHAVDGIVIGTHGRTGVERLFLGSVTERVLRHATNPVLTVKTSDLTD